MLVPMGRAQDSEVRGSGFDTYLNLEVTLSKILCPPEYSFKSGEWCYDQTIVGLPMTHLILYQ